MPTAMKNFFPKLLTMLVTLTMIACQSSKEGPQDTSEQADSIPFKLNYDAIADMIIKRAALQQGERVILVATPDTFDTLTSLLKEKIIKTKAEFLGVFSVTEEKPDHWQTKFTKEAPSRSEGFAQYLMSVDLGIMLPGTDTTHMPYDAMQDVLRSGHGRTIHFHWAGAYQMNGSLKSRTQYVDEVYQTALLKTDYDALSRIQMEFENTARKNKIRITTPLGTDIQFMIGNRPVTRQDGNASKARSETARNFIDREIELPAGAVRVAPLEESVEGKIAFPPMIWNGVVVNGLIMEFNRGQVTSINATEGLDAVKNELQQAGPEASSFRELAVGFNPLLAIPQIGPQWIPYYGYGAGVIRLSLGDNSELGGKVGGGYVRWNFFVDATLQVGDEIWIQDGRLK